MKLFLKLLQVTLILFILSSYSDSRRIRSKHTVKAKGLGQNLLDLFAGFVSGISGADGNNIASCLPTAWRSQALRQDNSNTLPAQFDANVLGVFKFLFYTLKWALEVACIFKDQLLKYFKVVRRRNRRLFIQNFSRKWGWGIGNAISGAFNAAGNWVGTQWNNLKGWVNQAWSDTKSWTKEQLEKAKNWTKATWNSFVNGINSAVEQVKNLYRKVKTFITSESFINGVTSLIKCGLILKSLIMNIISVVKAVIAIVSGNVVQWAVMVVNFICNIADVYKAVQIALAIGQNGKPWYFTGKLVGHLLKIFGNTVSGKDTEENVKSGKTPSRFSQFLTFLKDHHVIQIASAASAGYTNYQAANARPKKNERGLVQDGQTIVVIHKLTNKSLHSHGINYAGGSRQQEVTGFGGRDANDYWTIHHFNRGLIGTGFKDGDVVTLVHKLTNKTLHSHGNIRSPVTGQQEVTGFGGRDSNDLWRLEIKNGDKYLRTGTHFKLIHSNTNHSLHSHGINLRNGSRQQEVTGFGGRDDNDWWTLNKIMRRHRRRH